MILYLARHGDAAHPGPNLPSVLTPQGKEDVLLVAERLAGMKVKPAHLWHSPKDRAVQTASLYAGVLRVPAANIQELKSISPGGDPGSVHHEIMAAELPSLFLVSHLPLLEELASLLVTGSDHVPHVAFPTGSVSCFEYKKNWKWLWSVNPASLKGKTLE
jgi:phosphohistidine phosphatase